MRKLLYNQAIFNDGLETLYTLYLKYPAESDVKEVVEFSLNYYLANKIYPSVNVLKEHFPEFMFIEENFNNKDEYLHYIKEKEVNIKNLLRVEIYTKLADPMLPYDKRVELLNKIESIEFSAVDNDTLLLDVKEVDLFDMYKNRLKKNNTGLMTNIPYLDDVTGGISEGKIFIVMSAPKSFKTSFLINTCVKNIIELEDNNTLFVSLEIPKDELLYKMIIRFSYDYNVDFSVLKILKGQLEEEELKKFKEMSDKFKKSMKSDLFIISTEDIKIDDIYMFRNQLEDIIKKNNIKTVFVDYLQLFKFFSKGRDNIYEYQNTIMSIFRYLSVTYNCRFVIASQVTREAQKKADKNEGRYDPSDVAESNAILRDCYYLVSLYSNDTLKQANQLKYQLLYHRDGETFSEPKTTFVLGGKYYIGGINNIQNLIEEEAKESNIDISDILNF